MANTPKKTTETKAKAVTETKEAVAETKIESTNIANEENEVLKQKLATMEQQMAMLMQMMGSNASNTQNTTDRDIEVISLTTGRLLLTTTGTDAGQKYDFGNQFESLTIPESDLRAIVRAMPETSRGGYFYINDRQFVEDAKLSSAYRNLMGKTELLEIFNKPYSDFIRTYNTSPVGQKKIILDMVISKKLNGEFVDANVLIELGKICGKDLMNIEPLQNLIG